MLLVASMVSAKPKGKLEERGESIESSRRESERDWIGEAQFDCWTA